ncbi:MAG: hypothetical protein JO219_12595 [Candidatus Eremiobacteraeota bacterium]|nr:hypothetical protein [Candidatus Eremiobacteraeota bacterium]MBV8366315.1 hypothetical protein [Candidatus Eremiobacteraeota bacterium]
MKLGPSMGIRFSTSILSLCVLASAVVVAACSGHAGVSPTAEQPQGGTCNGQTSAFAHPQMKPAPVIGGCPSPPPQWQIIVDNPGNNTATSYQFTTSGNATPLATMGPSQHLSANYGIWYDGDTGDFFVADASGTYGNTLNRYNLSCLEPNGQSGCPDSTLSGSNTGLNSPVAATENYGQMLPQGDEPAYTLNTGGTPAIIAQLENQGGNATPLYTIKGSNTGLNNGRGLAVDSDTSSPNFGAIYADNVSTPKVMMWLPSAQFPTPAPNQVINVAPYKTISGSNTGITDPVGLYVDIDGYLYVVNASSNKVLVFSPSQSGNVAPVNTITTGLNNPYGVAVDANLIVWTTNDGDNSIRSFTNGHGGSAVNTTIVGSNTGLNSPANLDVRISR